MSRYSIQSDGNWSGGGLAFLENLYFAGRRYPQILSIGNSGIPLVARNVVPHSLNSREYVLIPQNAWPYSRILSWDPVDAARWSALRVRGDRAARRAKGVFRISSSIPKINRATSSPTHNVLDVGFDEALREASEARTPEVRGRFVSIGSMTQFRNLSRLLQAYAEYRSLGGQRGLTIVGQGRRAREERIVAEARLIEGVEVVTEHFTRAQCLRMYQVAEAVILPSLVEASPFSLLEALSVNARVVASDISAHREMMGGLSADPRALELFSPTSAPALAASMLRVDEGLTSQGLHELLSNWQYREQAREAWADALVSWLVEIS